MLHALKCFHISWRIKKKKKKRTGKCLIMITHTLGLLKCWYYTTETRATSKLPAVKHVTHPGPLKFAEYVCGVGVKCVQRVATKTVKG